MTFIGSDFVEQGKRAADQMIKATGGKGEVAILLGAAGNNVTTDRTKGFEDRIKAKAPDLKVVFQQTGDFAREKGQQVTEQLIQSKPGINGVYAENDEMGLGAVTALKGAGKKPGDVKIVSVDGTRNARAGHRRRLDQRRHRVQPALRPAGLRRPSTRSRRARPSPRTSSSRTGTTTRPTPRPTSARRSDAASAGRGWVALRPAHPAS